MKKVIRSILLAVSVMICLTSCSTRYIPVAGDTVVGPYFVVLKLPTKELGGETTLDFWVGERLTERDYADCESVFQGFLGEGYELDENGDLPEYYVKYRIGNYPKIDSLSKGVLEIKITDPKVKVYGLTTESSLDDFEDLFDSLGAKVSRYGSGVNARIDEVWFRLYTPKNGIPEITISTQATGVVLID